VLNEDLEKNLLRRNYFTLRTKYPIVKAMERRIIPPTKNISEERARIVCLPLRYMAYPPSAPIMYVNSRMNVSVTLCALGVGAMVSPLIPGAPALAAAFATPAANKKKIIRYNHSIPRSLSEVIELGEETDLMSPVLFIREVSFSVALSRLFLIPICKSHKRYS
jgi:hypothetical protein